MIHRLVGVVLVSISGAGCLSFRSPLSGRERYKDPRDAAVHRQLKETEIPWIRFSSNAINEVVAFLHEASVAGDPKGKGVDIVLDTDGVKEMDPDDIDPFADAVEDRVPGPPVDPAGVPLITFWARHISLEEALKIVTRIARLSYVIHDGAILITPYRVHPWEAETLILHGVDPECLPPERLPGFSTLDVEERPKAVLEAFGLAFPPGSAVSYVPHLGKLMIKHKREELDTIREILKDVWFDVWTSDKLVETTLPEVDLRNVTLSEALVGLAERGRTHDPWQEAQGKGVNILFEETGDVAQKRITFQAREITLERVLDAICRLTGCVYEIQKDVVIVRTRPVDE